MAYHIEWPGFSGRKYKHYVYEWLHSFQKDPGNYIFCAVDAGNAWYPIYIGETTDLSQFCDDHHKMNCIVGLGATHIHAHTNKRGEQARLEEREDLIHIYKPLCQHF